jgi:hypothetical protein
MNLLPKTLFTTDRNHNDSYLSNPPRAIQTNFQHSRAHQKYFSRTSSRRIDQRNITRAHNAFARVGRRADRISSPFDASRRLLFGSTSRPQPQPAFRRAISASKPDVLAPSRPHPPLIPARILLQQSRLLLNWKYFDDIVGCGFHAASQAVLGPAHSVKNRQERQFPAAMSPPRCSRGNGTDFNYHLPGAPAPVIQVMARAQHCGFVRRGDGSSNCRPATENQACSPPRHICV